MSPADMRVHVVVAGHNDGLRYSPGAAETEAKNLVKNRPHLEGRIEIIPAQ